MSRNCLCSTFCSMNWSIWKRRFFDYSTNCQFVLSKGKEVSFERGKCWNGFKFPKQSLHKNAKYACTQSTKCSELCVVSTQVTCIKKEKNIWRKIVFIVLIQQIYVNSMKSRLKQTIPDLLIQYMIDNKVLIVDILTLVRTINCESKRLIHSHKIYLGEC